MSKKIKRIIFYIVVLILTIIVVKNINNNRIIHRIGEKLCKLYSLENLYYEEKAIDSRNESSISKRLEDNIYIEIYNGEKKVIKRTFYDFAEEKGGTINEDGILVTSIISPILEIRQNEEEKEKIYNISKTKSETYCMKRFMNENMRLEVIRLKNVKSKKIDGKKCYEITIEIAGGIEKTYFDKETLLPIKTILSKDNKDITKNIIIKENNVTIEELIIPEDIEKMTEKEYMEYNLKVKNN